MTAVRLLLEEGRSPRDVAFATGVPLNTVLRWRRGATRSFGVVRLNPWRPPDAERFSYLTGLYLGDGCLARHARTWALVITLDSRYPAIIAEAVAAIASTGATRRATSLPHREFACTRITSYWNRWPEAFPQHGPGRKHLRPIELAPWQREIVDEHPEAFLRGLVHSDGCRTVNRFNTRLPSGRVAEYEYVRYFFSNLSPDIRTLFCEYCERLGIRWTQSNHRNISVSHRASVAKLDAFIGPKT
jgi:hypothetical protein